MPSGSILRVGGNILSVSGQVACDDAEGHWRRCCGCHGFNDNFSGAGVGELDPESWAVEAGTPSTFGGNLFFESTGSIRNLTETFLPIQHITAEVTADNGDVLAIFFGDDEEHRIRVEYSGGCNHDWAMRIVINDVVVATSAGIPLGINPPTSHANLDSMNVCFDRVNGFVIAQRNVDYYSITMVYDFGEGFSPGAFGPHWGLAVVNLASEQVSFGAVASSTGICEPCLACQSCNVALDSQARVVISGCAPPELFIAGGCDDFSAFDGTYDLDYDPALLQARGQFLPGMGIQLFKYYCSFVSRPESPTIHCSCLKTSFPTQLAGEAVSEGDIEYYTLTLAGLRLSYGFHGESGAVPPPPPEVDGGLAAEPIRAQIWFRIRHYTDATYATSGGYDNVVQSIYNGLRSADCQEEVTMAFTATSGNVNESFDDFMPTTITVIPRL